MYSYSYNLISSNVLYLYSVYRWNIYSTFTYGGRAVETVTAILRYALEGVVKNTLYALHCTVGTAWLGWSLTANATYLLNGLDTLLAYWVMSPTGGLNQQAGGYATVSLAPGPAAAAEERTAASRTSPEQPATQLERRTLVDDSRCRINELPDELLAKALSHVDFGQRACVASVCRHWRRLLSGPAPWDVVAIDTSRWSDLKEKLVYRWLRPRTGCLRRLALGSAYRVHLRDPALLGLLRSSLLRLEALELRRVAPFSAAQVFALPNLRRVALEGCDDALHLRSEDVAARHLTSLTLLCGAAATQPWGTAAAPAAGGGLRALDAHSGGFPSFVAELRGLAELRIAAPAQHWQLPAALSGLEELSHLELHHVHSVSLPHALLSLRALRTVSLVGVQQVHMFEALPSSLVTLRLEGVAWSDAIAAHLAAMTQLTALTVVGSRRRELLPRALCRLQLLQRLTLEEQGEVPEGGAAVGGGHAGADGEGGGDEGPGLGEGSVGIELDNLAPMAALRIVHLAVASPRLAVAGHAPALLAALPSLEAFELRVRVAARGAVDVGSVAVLAALQSAFAQRRQAGMVHLAFRSSSCRDLLGEAAAADAQADCRKDVARPEGPEPASGE